MATPGAGPSARYDEPSGAARSGALRPMSPPTAADDALLQRVLEPVRRTGRELADEVVPVGSGWLLRTPSLPWVWSLNQLHLTGPTTLAEAAALADEHQRAMPFRHLTIEDDPSDGELERAFRAAGWNADREVYMVLGVAPAPRDAGKIVDLDEEQATALLRTWIVEEHPDIGARGEQLVEAARREAELWGERCFGILADDGTPESITKLRRDGSIAWVEDVYTAPEARGLGNARALVTHVCALAARDQPDLTFLIADDNDWPKELYASVGFRPVGRTHTFHLDLGV